MEVKNVARLQKKSKSNKYIEAGKRVARGLAGKRGKKEKGKSRKKSAGWYAKEITRLKLKKRYNKVKYGVNI